MIGAIIGAASGIAGSLIGGHSARQAMRKANAILDKQEKDNQNWFDRRYNENYTQTAEAQAALTKARDYATEIFNRSAGASKVAGATDEAVALAKAAGNNVISDTASSIASQGTARKDAIESQYLTTKNNIAGQRLGMLTGQAQSATQAANQAMSSGMGLVGADLSAYLDKGKGLFESMFKK